MKTPDTTPNAETHIISGRAEIIVRVLVDGKDLPPQDGVRVLCAVFSTQLANLLLGQEPELVVSQDPFAVAHGELG